MLIVIGNVSMGIILTARVRAPFLRIARQRKQVLLLFYYGCITYSYDDPAANVQ